VVSATVLQALDQIGALLRMVLIVIRDMRYFFMMLLFLLISFGLTFSVLMSPASTSKVNIVSLMGSRQVEVDEGQVRGAGSLLFTELGSYTYAAACDRGTVAV
jgi:hypothetical protein